jgi:hypothetical protein
MNAMLEPRMAAIKTHPPRTGALEIATADSWHGATESQGYFKLLSPTEQDLTGDDTDLHDL